MENADDAFSPTLGSEAANILMMHRRNNPSMSGPSPFDKFWSNKLVKEKWGLDPDMQVDELHRRLAIAERVIKADSTREHGWIEAPFLMDHLLNGGDR